jgi:hypothetical protein
MTGQYILVMTGVFFIIFLFLIIDAKKAI